MAKTASVSNLSDEKLLENLTEKGFNLSELKKKFEWDYENKAFNEHLAKVFDISALTDEEKLVLKRFSIFPSQPLSFEYAEKWFEQENPDILNELSNKGWLIKTKTGFYMHHVISDVVRYENAPIYEECDELINLLAVTLKFDNYEMFTSLLPILSFAEKVDEYFGIFESENFALLAHNIADIYYEQGEYDKAFKFLSKSLEIKEKVLGKEDISTARTRSNISNIYRKKGNHKESLKILCEISATFEKILGKENIETSIIYDNKGVDYENLGEPDKALDLHKKALAIRERVLSEEHIWTAKTYNNMATAYASKGEDDNAWDYYERALTIFEENSNKDPISLVTIYCNIAYFCSNRGKYGKSLELYIKAYKICLTLPEGHPITIEINKDLEWLYDNHYKNKTDNPFEVWLKEQLSQKQK